MWFAFHVMWNYFSCFFLFSVFFFLFSVHIFRKKIQGSAVPYPSPKDITNRVKPDRTAVKLIAYPWQSALSIWSHQSVSPVQAHSVCYFQTEISSTFVLPKDLTGFGDLLSSTAPIGLECSTLLDALAQKSVYTHLFMPLWLTNGCYKNSIHRSISSATLEASTRRHFKLPLLIWQTFLSKANYKVEMSQRLADRELGPSATSIKWHKEIR